MKIFIVTALVSLSFCFGIVIYAYDQLETINDTDVMRAIPNNLEPQKVLHKNADIWDGSCMMIAVEISEKAAAKIIENSTDFLNELIFSKFNAQQEKWQKMPFQNEEDYKDIKTAIWCSDIDLDFKESVLRAIEDSGNYYIKNSISRTYYTIIPKDKLLIMTHWD